MKNKRIIIVFILICIITIFSLKIMIKNHYKGEKCPLCSYYSSLPENDYRYREEENGYEYYKAINDIKIYKTIENHMVTKNLYCKLGMTKNEKEIMAPYHEQIGCIYTKDICEILKMEGSTIINNVDMSKCNE